MAEITDFVSGNASVDKYGNVTLKKETPSDDGGPLGMIGDFASSVGSAFGGLSGMSSSGGGDPFKRVEDYMVDPRLAGYGAGGLLNPAGYGDVGIDFSGYRSGAMQGDTRTEYDRERALAALSMLKSQAEGSAPSPAQIAAQRERAAMNNAIQAQAATGAYSPAAQRAAMYAKASGGADLGQRAAEAAARERLAAQQAYAAAAAQHYGMGASLEASRGKLGAGYTAMDYQQAADNRAAKQQESKDRMGIHQSQLAALSGIAQAKQQADAANKAAKYGAIGTIAGAILS